MDLKTLKFSPTHEWVHIEGAVATVGISRFAVEQLTDLTLIELPPVGTRLTAGKSFGVVESVKSASDLYAPIGGEVIAVNDDLTKNVQLLSDDPYGKGWLIQVRVENPVDTSELMDLETYEKTLTEDH
jgi:glycine cleavage system H protein